MGFSKSIQLPLPLLFLLILILIAKKVVSQEEGTFFSYDPFDESSDNLIFQGDAFIHSPFARLTGINPSSLEPMPSSIGRLVYSKPVSLWEEGLQASFVTSLLFAVNASTNPSVRTGDGFNFFIVPVNSTIPRGSIDGSLGLFNPQTGNASSVFAVEFDIASNRWDPRYHHIGIDINSRVSRNVSRFDNSVGRSVYVHISYWSQTRTINVYATYGPYNSTLSYVFDLKTILPKQVHVGISATTGSSVAYHDLYYWAFSSSLFPDTNIAQYV